MLNKKVQLPPISQFFEGASQSSPLIRLNISDSENDNETDSMSNMSDSNESSGESAKSAPYSLSDDLSIFQVVASYYGYGFHGKIPWSFWQTYKRVTGSSRSNSSLYHHWNGAMKKKYEIFIKTGRLSQVIVWLQNAINSESQHNQNQANAQQHEITGAPLFHNKSQPPIPLQNAQANPLIRTASSMNAMDFHFSQFSYV